MISMTRVIIRRGCLFDSLSRNPLLAKHLFFPRHQLKMQLGLTETCRLQATTSSPPSDDNKKKSSLDDRYIIKFKEGYNVKEIFKKFYSLYGPLFVVCHISVSLASLGTFMAIVWPMVDPIAYLPDALVEMMGKVISSATQGGGKFVVAYAIHKLILPVRLGLAIWLTKRLAPRINLKGWLKNKKTS